MISSKQKNGFTVVELLIVIVVIGILAALTVVTFNSVRQNALDSLAKDTLKKGIGTMLADYVETGSYATAFSPTLDPPGGLGLALTNTSSTDEFCINVTSSENPDLALHVREDQQITEGLCSEEVIAESIIGDYNLESVGEPETAAGSLDPSTTTFAGATNEAWSQLVLSWEPVTDALRYEIQLRTSPSGEWQLRRYTDEPTRANGAVATYQNDSRFSAQIPNNLTSITWSGPFATPLAADAVYEYRFRAHLSGGPTEWTTGSLAAPTLASQEAIAEFSATLSGAEDSVTLAWTNQSPHLTPGAFYEIQLRDSPTGTWMLRRIIDEVSSPNAPISSYQDNAAFSAQIPGATDELTWIGTPARPASGQTFEYRIRVKSATIQNLVSDWTTIQLTNS
ncbi:MAG TPA: prepilin-type N-terminal cleavage/methylation domain-containing protein [Candidatus Saccharimonadaceae bacterium]|nr:prepilin-type N-terminal cleavage/methylation domain-containing protein [Candidatus Saccharimonadaceae bacterium]